MGSLAGGKPAGDPQPSQAQRAEGTSLKSYFAV